MTWTCTWYGLVSTMRAATALHPRVFLSARATAYANAPRRSSSEIRLVGFRVGRAPTDDAELLNRWTKAHC
jgi:hypothetical protein